METSGNAVEKFLKVKIAAARESVAKRIQNAGFLSMIAGIIQRSLPPVGEVLEGVYELAGERIPLLERRGARASNRSLESEGGVVAYTSRFGMRSFNTR